MDVLLVAQNIDLIKGDMIARVKQWDESNQHLVSQPSQQHVPGTLRPKDSAVKPGPAWPAVTALCAHVASGA